MNCANSAVPLGLELENITVTNNGRAAARGISIGIGSPKQVVAFQLSTSNSATWVFNDCGDATNFACIGYRGGVYNSTLSSSFRQTTRTAWNGSVQMGEYDTGPNIFFNDDLYFGSNDSESLHGFPIILDQPGDGAQSTLGIGPQSNFLDELVKSGSAPSRAFGLWPGSRSLTNPVDGVLWVGGYDAGRVAGQFTNFPDYSNNGCVGCVTITNITYIESSRATSLLSSGERFTVSLHPAWNFLQVPSNVFANFLQASNGTVGTESYTQGFVTVPTTANLGNLSVTFSNGYETTIPSSELFLPPRGFGEDGTYEILDDTYLVAEIANTTITGNTAFSWGVPILTMNYMIIDYDNVSFSLAPAVQGPYGGLNAVLVEPLCKGVPPVSTTVGTSPSPSTTTPAPTSSSAATPPPSKSHTNIGAIAGGVVGGVFGLAIIAILAFFLLRSRKRERALRQERDSVIANPTTIHNTKFGGSQGTTMSSPQMSDVHGWLHSQHNHVAVQPHMTSTLNQPLEMPAHRNV